MSRRTKINQIHPGANTTPTTARADGEYSNQQYLREEDDSVVSASEGQNPPSTSTNQAVPGSGNLGVLPPKAALSDGYPKLASFMERCSEEVIFRRFRRLNLLNLMSLQAELLYLEREYTKACQRDFSSESKEVKDLSKSFYELREVGDKSGSDQYEWLMEIRKKLKEYNSTLLEVSQVFKLEEPDKYDLERLREWLEDIEKGKAFLQGPEEHTWDARNDADQLTLAVRENGFSRWTAIGFIMIYDKLWGRHGNRTRTVEEAEGGQKYYPESNIKHIAKVVTSVLASLIPGVVVLGLALIDTTMKRIGAMLCFTSFFAFVLSYWTPAQTIDIFAATAAFAAVEVVFIGSAITNSTSP